MDRDAREPESQGRARRLKERAVEEVRRFVVLFLYLWLLFGLFVLNESIILRQHGIDFVAQGFAVFNALVLAKVMLVAEDLNLGGGLGGLLCVAVISFFALIPFFAFTHFSRALGAGRLNGLLFGTAVGGADGGRVSGTL